ncbi:MAG: DUF2236 domain-containing protein [Bacteroidetes bacterium]|nr:MAG: DUF2236 domain-containing protein [Bacteroidota bacterium]
MISLEQLQSMRQSSDRAADDVIKVLFQSGAQDQMAKLMALEGNADPLPNDLHPDLLQFIQDCSKLPDWADPQKITDSEAFFDQYQVYVYTALLFAALPYCYAAADGARVLSHSNRMEELTQRRLSETGQFIQDVSEPGAFGPKGKAFRSIAKVRLIHAAVRFHLLKKGHWNSEWGLPTNMEDMAGTNLAFSIVTLRAVEKLGVELSPPVKDAFLHKWNLISHLLGLDKSLLATDYKEALRLEKQIVKRLFRPSPEGKKLTKSLVEFIHHIEKPLAPNYGSHMMRYLLGNQVGDILGLEEIPLFNWPSLMSHTNALVHKLGWSPKLNQMHIPLHLSLIKRGEIENQRIEYPLDTILKGN